MLVSHEIHYEVEGGEELLALFTAFATSIGWTADVWTGSELQLYSPGYSVQNLVYRFRTYNLNVQADWIVYKGVAPAGRGSSFSLTSTDCYAPNASIGHVFFSRVTVPTSPFTVYLFGTSTFLAMVLHVSPTIVITVAVGLLNLFRGWRDYENGLGCAWASIASSTESNAYWYEAENNLPYIYFPLSRYGQLSGENTIFLSGIGGEDQSHLTTNFSPSYSDDAHSSISGLFNRMRHSLNYSSFSGRRTAFYSTWFLKHNTSAIWYPLGMSPCAFTNGYGLQIGQEITFGLEKFIAFPIVHFSQKIWQLWRIE